MNTKIFDNTTRALYKEIQKELMYFRGIAKHRIYSFLRALSFSVSREDIITLGFKNESRPFFPKMFPAISFLPPVINVYNMEGNYIKTLFYENDHFPIKLKPARYYIKGDQISINDEPITEEYIDINTEDTYRITNYYGTSQLLWYADEELQINEYDIVPIINPQYRKFFKRIFKYWGDTGNYTSSIEVMILTAKYIKRLMLQPSMENIARALNIVFTRNIDDPWASSSLSPTENNPYYEFYIEPGSTLTMPVFHYYNDHIVFFQVGTYNKKSSIENYYYVPIDFKQNRYLIEIDKTKIYDYITNESFSYYEPDYSFVTSSSIKHSIIPRDESPIVIYIDKRAFTSKFYPPLNIFFEILATVRSIVPVRVPILLAIDNAMMSYI